MKSALLLMLAITFSVAADRGGISSVQPQPVAGELAEGLAVPQCLSSQLTVRHLSDDAAMGGQRSVDYAFTNTSSAPCVLKGYPRFELLTKYGRALGRIRVVWRDQLLGEEEKSPPRMVRLEPGQEAWFRVHYNSGGAGYLGKPCPTAAKVKITAPGAKRGSVLREQIQSCREVEVSPVRSGQPTN